MGDHRPRFESEMENMIIKKFFVAVIASMAAIAWAGDCSDKYADGVYPIIINQAMTQHARALCFDEFAVMHSGITRTPLWSAERLTGAQLQNARALKRENTFHPETQLPSNERSELRDFARSGFDRGHLVPSGNAGTQAAQNQTFTLANMIPQNPNNNRQLWEGIESAVRTLAQKRGTLYVITGPLFEGENLKRLNNRVMVPTSIYKVVYDPQRRQAAAYVTKNEEGMAYKVLSVAELEARAGINLLPGAPASVKTSAMSLPAPTPHGYGDHAAGGGAFASSEHSSHARHGLEAGLGAMALSHMYKSFSHRRY
jgi:endonuclease G